MIITVTPNPSIDRTVMLDRPLERGGMFRLSSPVDVAGGKGINVARVLHRAGVDPLVILPAPEGHEVVRAIGDEGMRVERTDARGVRTNLMVTEVDGTTTQFIEPGPELSVAELDALERLIGSRTIVPPGSPRDLWVVLGGSLPPGVPLDWYLRMTARLRLRCVRVAVDTSDAPIRAFAEAEVLPDLMKPNGAELAMLTGNSTGTGQQLEAAAAAGDYAPVLAAAQGLHRRGCGAVLVTEGQAWVAKPPPTTLRSTVGVGDSSLAGYLLGVLIDKGPAERLRLAVAAGAAAASLTGSGMPGPGQFDLDRTEVELLQSRVAEASNGYLRR